LTVKELIARDSSMGPSGASSNDHRRANTNDKSTALDSSNDKTDTTTTVQNQNQKAAITLQREGDSLGSSSTSDDSNNRKRAIMQPGIKLQRSTSSDTDAGSSSITNIESSDEL
jgi:hypothetical protein